MLCRSMTFDSAFGKVELVPCGWYMFESLRNTGLDIMEMSRPFGPWMAVYGLSRSFT